MATVDSLEVVIESDAKKAIDQLDLLAEKLGKVSAALSSIGNSPGLKQLTEKLAGLQSGMTKNMKDIGRPIEQQTKKASKSLRQIFEDCKDLGKGINFTGNVPALQKQLDSYTNLLQKALLKESELGAAGNTGGKMYEYAVKDVLKYSNLIEGLQGQIGNLNASAASKKMDFPMEMPGEQSWNLEDFKSSLGEMQELISESFGGRHKELLLGNLGTELKELKERFPEAVQEIRQYEEAIQRLSQVQVPDRASAGIQEVSASAEKAQTAMGRLAGLFGKLKVPNALGKQMTGMSQKAAQGMERALSGLSGGRLFAGLHNGAKNISSAMGGLVSKVGLFGRAAISAAGKASKAFSSMKSVMKGISSFLHKFSLPFSKISKAVVGLTGKMKSLVPVLGSAKKAGGGLGGTFRTLGTTAKFMFTSFALYGTLNAAKEGMQNLAQYSDRTNASMSMLMSSLAQLKNSLAVAFAPILDFVAPALDTLIQSLSKAMNMTGQFFSALTGKTNAVQATRVNLDYAKSLQAGGDSAKSTEKKVKDLGKALSVLSFDQLNQLSKPNEGTDASGESGSTEEQGLSPQDMFEIVPIENKIKDLADSLKNAWKNADFTEIGADIGAKLKNALDNIPWEEIQSTAGEIGKSFATLLNGIVQTDGLGYTIGNSIAQAINTGLTGLEQFAANLGWGSVGTFISDGVNGALENIDWATALSAAHYLGTGLATMLNNALTPEVFNNIGHTIGMGINTALTFVSDFLTTLNWAGIGNGIGGGLKTAIDTIDWGLLGGTIGNAVESIFELFEGFVGSNPLEGLGSKVATAINNAVSQIDLGSFAVSLSSFAISFLGELSTAIQETDWSGVGQKISDALKNIDWLGIASGLFGVGLELIGGILDAFGELPAPVQIAGGAIGGFLAVMGGMSAITSVLGLLSSLAGAMNPVTLGIGAVIAVGTLVIANWDDIKKAAGDLKDWVVEKTVALKDGAVEAFGTLKGNVGDAMEAIKTSAKDGWEGAKTKFSNFDSWMSQTFKHDWTENFGAFGNVLNGFSKTISNKWDSIKKIFSGITTFLSGTFSGNWDKAWSGIRTAFEGVWQGFSATVKTPINLIIGMINGLLSGIQTMQNGIAGALNNLRIDIPDWLQGITGYSSFGFNIPPWTAPQISYLAKGGLVTSPVFAHMGELSRPEAILPLTDHHAMSQISESIYANAPEAGIGLSREEIKEAVIEGVVTAMMNNSQNTGSAPEYIQNSIYLDGDVMARAVTRANGDRAYRLNASPAW